MDNKDPISPYNYIRNLLNIRNRKLRKAIKGVVLSSLIFFMMFILISNQSDSRKSVDCFQIIEGNASEISFAAERGNDNFATDNDIRKRAQNCTIFSGKYHFPASQEERDFPIAFSLLVHKDAVQIETLLRAIYRPHNVYCIHVDKRSTSALLDAVKSIANCLRNVFIATKLEDVIYEGYSRLQADINCMTDLLSYTDVNWKYLINLPAQEFPLKTNNEIVKILKIFNGTSSIESTYDGRFEYRVNESYIVNPKTLKVESTGRRKDPPPHNIIVGKGSAYGAFSRKFVDFAVNDIKAREILKWTEDTFSPDETFWATLAINKQLGTPGIKYTASGVPDRRVWITTSVTWNPEPCRGKYVRDICVFGVGDLHSLVLKKELFANKFYYDYQPYALICMEKWIQHKSLNGLTSDLDLKYYRDLINS
ncbi:N-acetyllactosaminide beta-1,6-N-acetylglucosaminyl-transferase-like isoform X3 [Crassostrea virginica]